MEDDFFKEKNKNKMPSVCQRIQCRMSGYPVFSERTVENQKITG